ncbi:MAG: efflux RND transporter permease subunit [Nitrospirae bacterium]|nr:efflux RND transporter permease subunit [Nitrospirota bacterium]
MSEHPKTGISGKVAKAFLRSRLTPLLVIASLLLGVFAVVITPREEEPQIVVPMMDVFVPYPGATAKEVEERVTKPMEKKLWEVEGVEYLYSITRPGMSMAVVRFYVGEDMEKSIVRLYNKLMSNYDIIPSGVMQPLVKPRSIDDVPVFAATLWSDKLSAFDLRRVAAEMTDNLSSIDNVSEVKITGGERRQVKIQLDPVRLRGTNLSALQVLGALGQANTLLPSGSYPEAGREVLVQTGGFITSAEDASNVVIGVFQGRPVYLRDVARVEDGPADPTNYVLMGLGPAAGMKGVKASADRNREYPAVTIAVSKKKGSNASVVAEEAIKRLESMRATVIPSEVAMTVTRNYGETAKDKSDELLEHMLIATISVIILIALALGWRESVVVAVAVPVTLALTLLVNYLNGYTLNRVTLFALIFSIGILVDDAIVVVENIHRHFRMRGVGPRIAVEAVDEVGNPTILATFTVIAALLPLAFVRGLMGPYMSPIPIGASAAMIFSLLVAFIVSPWLSYKVLGKVKGGHNHDEGEGLTRFYGALMRPLLESRKKRFIALGMVLLLLLASITLVPLKKVTMKMLPFDNKSELQVIIDMPEGATLETTARVGSEIGQYLRTVPEVTDYQLYTGAASPYNFNGLVRHYFMRAAPHEADIQVNFAPKSARSLQSHDIAKRIRPAIIEIGKRHGANVKIAEIPPGPPVLSTLVAEIYGPDSRRMTEIAREVRRVFETTDGVVDVDWYVEDAQDKITFEVDRTKAAMSGISADSVSKTLAVALGGMTAGQAHMPREKEPVEMMVRLPVSERAGLAAISGITVPSTTGAQVPLAELVSVRRGTEEQTIYHKNLKNVIYVTGDVAGTEESPVYAIMKMKEKLAAMRLPEGYELKQYSSTQPELTDRYAMKWDGEWHITYEVFRDMGIAFAAVLILIYVLVVAWFRDFVTPLVIMAPIPLTLVGILPGHWIFGAFFTATSMIGFIALAGIIVRNSILLVDFVRMEWREKGSLKDALVMAGAVRFRPIALTAAAVVVGSFVMLFDPIFQGLAISMMFGAVASTALTLVAVPLLYYEFFRNKTIEHDDDEGSN